MLALALLWPTPSEAVRLDPVISGLQAPLYVTHSRDGSGRLFIVEQGGRIRVLRPGVSTSTVFLDIAGRVLSGGEQGLLGLAFHPQFAGNRRFFVNYTRRPDGATVIAEYQGPVGGGDVADPNTERILLVIPQPFTNHNGGMVEFGPDGFLYIAMGDGGSGNDPGNRAQNPNDLLGKILRLDVNGAQPYAIPPDNPFAGGGGRGEIYALGFRNPFRFSFDRLTGDLLAGDVGQDAREEIDRVTRGGNYGWRVFEGTSCTGLGPAPCNPASFIPPIIEYAHQGGRCAVIGGYAYRVRPAACPSARTCSEISAPARSSSIGRHRCCSIPRSRWPRSGKTRRENSTSWTWAAACFASPPTRSMGTPAPTSPSIEAGPGNGSSAAPPTVG